MNNCVIEENLEGTSNKSLFSMTVGVYQLNFVLMLKILNFAEINLFANISTRLCHIDIQALDQNFTYSFILQIPENRLVSNIQKRELYHIETHNNITGEKILSRHWGTKTCTT